MSLEEYRDVWKQEDAPAEERPGDAELLAQVKERSQAFDRKIRRRDWLEIAAAAVVVLLFGYEAVTAASWLARVGAGIVVAGSVLIVWRLRRARRDGDSTLAGRPVAERLRSELEKVDAQIRLLESVLWWYVAPPTVGAILFVVGIGEGLDSGTLIAVAVILAVGALVWWLNQRAVRRDLRPRRRELADLLERIEAGDESGGDRES